MRLYLAPFAAAYFQTIIELLLEKADKLRITSKKQREDGFGKCEEVEKRERSLIKSGKATPEMQVQSVVSLKRDE